VRLNVRFKRNDRLAVSPFEEGNPASLECGRRPGACREPEEKNNRKRRGLAQQR